MKATLKSIVKDLNNNDLDCLYFATEDQIDSLINSNKIDEDYAYRASQYREEMEYISAAAMAEFA
tara:strand:+ start:926 stop:1120 length:195 start_codon:yes stop_codon:yes gene_type:complete